MLKTICYISDSQNFKSEDNLLNLYNKAKTNNLKHNITGILIYKNGNFLQVLEGEQEMVDNTFKRISLDSRHKNIIKVINTTVEQRIFEDYNFGFTTIDNRNELNNLNDYLEWLKDADSKSANKVIAMVENFIGRK
ncbi:BLUF domain-containing protein [Snuella sedimenti]|uniref:BLUF domain-containing protein n=1 Tax=Snuella sedimenti TaxID=2798802 RepID=A0A8J7LY22_9FLAO|nr:BLUF domain-containing protein [Snuella sedimenti]MBJ6367826.1 BLUF domain-containing protein [Snuella sedimenti]